MHIFDRDGHLHRNAEHGKLLFGIGWACALVFVTAGLLQSIKRADRLPISISNAIVRSRRQKTMAILNINPFDDEVFAELQKLPRSQTIKQFITEAVCAKLQIPVPPQPQRGRPKDVEVVK